LSIWRWLKLFYSFHSLSPVLSKHVLPNLFSRSKWHTTIAKQNKFAIFNCMRRTVTSFYFYWKYTWCSFFDIFSMVQCRFDVIEILTKMDMNCLNTVKTYHKCQDCRIRWNFTHFKSIYRSRLVVLKHKYLSTVWFLLCLYREKLDHVRIV